MISSASCEYRLLKGKMMTTWQREAVAWLRGKAAEQAQNNERWPEHAKCYPSWTERVEQMQHLANELEREARDEAGHQADEATRLRALLRRGMRQLEAWQEKYGEWQPQWLPPAGDVRWAEDVEDALKTPNAELRGASRLHGEASLSNDVLGAERPGKDWPMYKKPNLKKLQAECDKFNAAHQIGADVFVKLDGVDEPYRTKTRSDAQVLSGHSAVIWLENVSGCYLLDRVTPAPNALGDRLRATNDKQGEEA